MHRLFIGLIVSVLSISCFAEDSQILNTDVLPDGSSAIEYGSTKGAKVKEVQRSDGTIETTATDAQGRTTTIKAKPDGSIESIGEH